MTVKQRRIFENRIEVHTRLPRQSVVFLVVCLLINLFLYSSQHGETVKADDEPPNSSGDFSEIYRRVTPSVVSIQVEIGLFDDASGTGFVIDNKGHIVTNAHVVEDAQRIQVLFHDGSEVAANLIGMDSWADIAVIKVDVARHRLKSVTFGDSDDLAVGQSVLAIGNPFGLEATLTTGIISGLRRKIEFDDGSVLEGMIQTDAAIAPGSSGGPLLSLHGEVIGVNSAGYGGRFGGTNFGFAIASNKVQNIAGNMIDSVLTTQVAVEATLEAREETLKALAETWEAQEPTREAQRKEAAATETAEAALHATLEARITRTPPTSTPLQPTVFVRSDSVRPVIQQPASQEAGLSISGASVYQYNVGVGEIFTFNNNIQLSGGVRLFLQNPVDPNSFLRTDYKGVLRYRPIGVAQESEFGYSPYFAGFSNQVPSYEQNKNRIVELDWSADGRQFSFRIDTPLGLDNAGAGVWFWQPRLDSQFDPTYLLILDCPVPGYNPCDFVFPSNAKHWKTFGVQWSPVRGDNNVLLSVLLPEEGRNAQAIVQALRDPKNADNAPHFVRYDYATWNPNGQGITVSGRRPDGRVIIGVVNNNLAGEQVILDGSARGLWLRDAVRLPNGQYRALGRPGSPGSGPVALYDQNGNQMSDFIGPVAPEDVRWFPDRSAVLVSVQARQYTISADGSSITDNTEGTSNPQFGVAPAAAPQSIPDGVIAGSEYSPGQQLRIAVDYLNLRSEPSTASAVQGGLVLGDYVAIIAGPYDNQDYRWWRVQTADGRVGWLAGTINGAPTLQRP